MTNAAPNNTAEALQHARAAHLRELFEPWSLRRLETRTGLGRGTLQGRLNGSTALTLSDIEVLAPVIRMTAAELFAELLAVQPNNEKGPASMETGPRMLPDLDSNQEPIGSQSGPSLHAVERLATVTPLPVREGAATVEHIGLAKVTRIGASA